MTKTMRMANKNALATLGCCYDPEQWPQNMWNNDAKRMVEMGLSIVRIGEFAWSRIEPMPDSLDWQWLDEAMDTLGDAGLGVVLGTPTATPPKWMLDKHPDMLAVDKAGNLRRFGSRRHYCFSHGAYRDESKRIAGLMAERYAQHPALLGWQIDNEYGCHDTIRSYSQAARNGFRLYLSDRYKDIAELNKAWGNVFWSMEYASFDDVDLPNLTVTEANPSHWLDFLRFSSDQVVVYNKTQVDAIKEFSDKPLIHNYMGRIVEFDHYKVGEDLDIASWDSYPLGFLVDRSGADPEWQKRFERQGDPDLQAMHHDLYRAVGRGRWWIMEQQPGPVNWAPNNPAPLPGMVEFWTWEAIAHQAEAVCYFRWRQAPFAQEQMHAGLMRPDDQPATAYQEVSDASTRIAETGPLEFDQADVALVFDYESCWAWEVQPQGDNFDGFSLALEFYRALRRLGVNIDVVSPNADLDGYKLVLAPGLFSWNDRLLAAINNNKSRFVLGPRSGSKTADFQIPASLPPALTKIECKVTHVETFAKGHERDWHGGGTAQFWLEHCELGAGVEVLETLEDGTPTLFKQNELHYLAAWPDAVVLQRLLKSQLAELNIEVYELPEGVRRRVSKEKQILFNYNPFAVDVDGRTLAAGSVEITSR